MILYNYIEFLNEANEVVLDISGKLQRVLKSMKDPIANDILKVSCHGETPGTYDIAYLDYFEDKSKKDKISFLPANKIVSGEMGDPFTTKGRQEMSVGKIVNKLFPNKFTQPQIEAFVNSFKTELTKHFAKIKLVEGEEIRYWYLDEHYAGKHGDVNSSCMRYKNSQKFFDIYCNNPEKCKLAVYLTDDDKKLLGRAFSLVGIAQTNRKNLYG
jgi:hypothetical protein